MINDDDPVMDLIDDPARWPFCEARAREAAAISAEPYEDQRAIDGAQRLIQPKRRA